MELGIDLLKIFLNRLKTTGYFDRFFHMDASIIHISYLAVPDSGKGPKSADVDHVT